MTHPLRDPGSKRGRLSAWPRYLLLAAPGLALLVLILIRVINPPPPRMPYRDLSQPSPNDPALQVPAYSNLVARLQRGVFLPTAEVSPDHLRRLLGADAVKLTPIQQQLFLSTMLDLIRAHHQGQAEPLRRVLFSGGEAAGSAWSTYGRRRLSIILAAAGHGSRNINRLLEVPSWEVVEQAWNQLVTEYRLTNWWSRLSPEQSALWIHQEKPEDLPALDSPAFGEFAGTVIGPSLIVRTSEPESQALITAATARLIVGFPGREKPIIYVFRWWWSEPDQVWYPIERLIGVVGDRFPDPFF